MVGEMNTNAPAVMELLDPLLSFLDKQLRHLRDRVMHRDIFLKGLRKVFACLETVQTYFQYA